MIRWPVAFVLVGLLAAAVAYDRVSELPAQEVATGVVETTVISPSLADPPRLDGAWYCPVGSSAPGSFARHEVQISNLSDTSAVANLSILTADGPGPGQRIELPPLSTERVALADTQEVDVAGAVVEITGGSGVVGHSVETVQGVAEGPCATHASSEWYFASGRTSFDSTQYLALMNPFPETAVFDIEFQAVGRSRKPGPLQGAFVKARSVRIIDVGEFVTREEALATTITTKRGRLVVERLQLMDGQLGPAGAALQLGVPTPAPSWIFTAGRVHDGGDDLLTIFNPNDAAPLDTDDVEDTDGTSARASEREGFVTVAVELWPNNPTDLSNYSVVTIEREIRPGTFAVIDLQAQAERFEFPLPYELGVNVTSAEGLPIVAERWQFGTELQLEGLETDPVIGSTVLDEIAPDEDPDNPDTPDPDADPADPDAEGGGEDDAAAPADDGAPGEDGDDTGGVEDGVSQEPFVLQPPEPVDSGLPQPIATQGLATSRGNELFSSRWVVPWVSMTGDSTLIAVTAALQEAVVEVRVLSDGQLVGPVRATIPAGGRTIIPVSVAGPGAAVEITSNTPVSAEATVVVPDVTFDVVPAVPTLR
ncbi:MAG: DUF5719 family protein [Actinomycetota bacterium]